MEKRKLFTRDEALAKRDKKIRSKIEFSGVPKGTTGVVLSPGLTDYTKDGKLRSLPIQWDLPERKGKPLVDWFSKYDYERFLEEI